MYKIRQIRYSAGPVSIQVYKIENRKRVIVRHIGTTRTQQELSDLLAPDRDFIEKASRQLFHLKTIHLITFFISTKLILPAFIISFCTNSFQNSLSPLL